MSAQAPPDRSPRGPAWRIVTRRLLLRCWEPEDAARLKIVIDANLDHLRPWMPWAAQEPEDVDAKADRLRGFRQQFEDGATRAYGIFDHDERTILGAIGSHARIGDGAREIGYWITAARLRQGIATEAAAALTNVGFRIEELRRMEIQCDPGNVASAGVPRRLGYRHVVTIPRRVPHREAAPRDTMIWAMLARDYPSSPAATESIQALDRHGRTWC